MFVVGKIVCAGVIVLLLTPWISGCRPMRVDSGTNLSSEVPAETDWNDVKEMQQTLQDKGQYQGKIDGVLALRTRASIRGFQKAENLPATGQLDLQTAGKLGVRPERQAAMSDQGVQDKPSAGITWADGARRSGRTLRKPAMKRARTVPPTLASIGPLEKVR